MEVKKRCTSGKRDKAEKEAKLFYDKVINLSAIMQIKTCTQDLIPDFDLKQRTHACETETMDFGIPDMKRINR